MTVTCAALVNYCDTLLSSHQFSDYCVNGLQVEGKPTITRLISGVTASLALIEAAIAAQADVLLVHHGYCWRGEDPCIRGRQRRRLAQLFKHDINLVAYHLPLDAHPVYGNQVQLAEQLGLLVTDQFAYVKGQAIGCVGRWATGPLSPTAVIEQLTQVLKRSPLHIPGRSEHIDTVAWCTGAAQDYIDDAIELNVDAFITGEVSERTVHAAREGGIHFFAAGHHATERYGVAALGTHLAKQFDLSHKFIDIDNPV